LYNTGSGGAIKRAGFTTGLTAACLTAARFTIRLLLRFTVLARRAGRARRADPRFVFVARMFSALPGRLPNRPPGTASALFVSRPLSISMAPVLLHFSQILLYFSCCPEQLRFGQQKLFTSGAPRSCDRCACCDASSCPVSGKPTEFVDDCPSLCLHHHRAGDRPGS